MVDNTNLTSTVRKSAYQLTGATTDYDPLMNLIGDASFVLLGEASHGTHEFYRTRAEITSRLIKEKGFTAVAVEADWPDAYRINRYVREASLTRPIIAESRGAPRELSCRCSAPQIEDGEAYCFASIR